MVESISRARAAGAEINVLVFISVPILSFGCDYKPEGTGEGNEIDGERKFIDESPPQNADSQPMKARRWV